MPVRIEREKLAGKFVVLDGPDGCGKTTQQAKLAEHVRGLGLEVVCCKDPGGTAIGDRVRQVLLDYDLAEMDVRCETLLFMASRAQLVAEVIHPALQANHCVVCSRFISSTCAYQGAAGADIKEILELGRLAVRDAWPDLTLVLDVPVEEGFRRTGRQPQHAGRHRRKHGPGQSELFEGARPDAMESRPLEFHRKVRNLLLDLPAYYPKPVQIVDASGSIEEVHQRVLEAIASAVW